MTADAAFIFVDAPADFKDAAARVIRVPAGARGKEKLLKTLSAGLQFPRYFGGNWDAFEECIRDLSWLRSSEPITIVHEALPFSPASAALKTYVSILQAAASARSAESGRLRAVFPAAARESIVQELDA